MSRLSNLADAAHIALDDSSIEKVIGRRKDGRNTQRRRIHWYSEGGTLQSTTGAGPNTVDGTKQPSVWERFERVACLVFAKSPDDLDDLLDNLIVAIDHTAPNGSVIFDGYTWDYGEVSQRVPMSELQFEIKWPIPDEIKTLTVITDEELTCDFEED